VQRYTFIAAPEEAENMFKRALTAAAAALIGAGTSIGTAAPASAFVWDLAWFFLHQCHAPPAAPAPEGPRRR